MKIEHLSLIIETDVAWKLNINVLATYFPFHSQFFYYAGCVSFQKPRGYAFKRYNSMICRKTRLQKIEKREFPTSPSYSVSYSPTSPVRRPQNYQFNDIGSPYQSEGSPERDRESLYQDRELSLSQSPSVPSVFKSSYQSYYSPSGETQSCPNLPCYSSPASQSISSLLSVQTSTAMSAPPLGQDISSPTLNPEMMAYPRLLEDKSLDHTPSPSFGDPPGFSECDTTHITSLIV